MMVATLSLCLCLCCSRCCRCPCALLCSFAYCVHAVITPGCIAISLDRPLANEPDERGLLPCPFLVLPDTCLDDTPHKFLGAVNNDKNCLLSHSFPTKALSQSFTHSLLLAHSLVELCVRSMSFRLCPPLLHIVAPFSLARSLSFSLLLHISAVACIDFVYRERRTTPPPPPLPLFIQ